MNESLDILGSFSSLCNSDWHSYIGVLKVFVLLCVYLASDAVDNDVRILDGMSALFLTGEVLKTHVALVPKISSNLQLFETRVPYSGILSVRVDCLSTHASKHSSKG